MTKPVLLRKTWISEPQYLDVGRQAGPAQMGKFRDTSDEFTNSILLRRSL